jgi:3-carboxy-cis,cis-muconate cycloisomerase
MGGLALTFADPTASQALSDERLLASMARFEAALAQACARTGLISASDAEVIASVCRTARFDTAALASAARKAGTLAIPFVKELTAQVAAASPQAARHVHFGATSQDVQDTALVLCLKDANACIDQYAVRLGDAASALAREHADTPCLARTLLQPALPVPFGWKAAVWLSLVSGSLGAFRACAKETCLLQFGGPAGTLSAYGEKSGAVEAALAEELGLAIPDIPWHSRRDGIARFGAAAAALAGAAAKVARDISLLMQPEVGEAAEAAGEGRGGSSSLPHKRNPAQSMLALEAAQRAPGLASTLLVQVTAEHERGLGQWQSQWITLRDLLGSAASALAAMGGVLAGLEVNVAAMRENIERMRGLVYSEALSIRLAAALGKQEAHHLTERLCARAAQDGAHLADVARADAQVMRAIDQDELSAIFQPQRGFGAGPEMIERARAQWVRVRG